MSDSRTLCLILATVALAGGCKKQPATTATGLRFRGERIPTLAKAPIPFNQIIDRLQETSPVIDGEMITVSAECAN